MDLYEAEETVADKGRWFITREQVQAYYDDLTSAPWWTELHPKIRRIELGGTPASRCASVGTYFDENACVYVELLTAHWWENYMLHEAAHGVAIATYGEVARNHGPHFARTLLDLVFRTRGPEAWQELRNAFANRGVSWDEREDA